MRMKGTISVLAIFTSVIGFTASPARADALLAYDSLSCSYQSSGQTQVLGNMKVYSITGDSSEFKVVMSVTSDPAGRTWTWKLLHNGSTSASGTKTGMFSVTRHVLDYPGSENLRFRLQNSQGTIDCSAYATV